MNRGPARFFLAISLVSVSTLIYEIGLTRIFSVSQGYQKIMLDTPINFRL